MILGLKSAKNGEIQQKIRETEQKIVKLSFENAETQKYQFFRLRGHRKIGEKSLLDKQIQK